jgi:hypothetical protein
MPLVCICPNGTIDCYADDNRTMPNEVNDCYADGNRYKSAYPIVIFGKKRRLYANRAFGVSVFMVKYTE